MLCTEKFLCSVFARSWFLTTSATVWAPAGSSLGPGCVQSSGGGGSAGPGWAWCHTARRWCWSGGWACVGPGCPRFWTPCHRCRTRRCPRGPEHHSVVTKGTFRLPVPVLKITFYFGKQMCCRVNLPLYHEFKDNFFVVLPIVQLKKASFVRFWLMIVMSFLALLHIYFKQTWPET